MKSLETNHAFYAFAPERPPALRVRQGELFTLDTSDCFANQLQAQTDTLDSLDWDRINPATGPVEIAGVKPGDMVRIAIETIELRGKSVVTTMPGSGAIAHITETSTRILEQAGGCLALPTKRGVCMLPIQPMIGVIGLAPAQGSIPTGTPGQHGGNMDCTLIGQGARLYLRAAVAGGMLGCGDVHALMGDGEALGVGAETPARITLFASTVNAPNLPAPFVETDMLYASIASAKTADEAYQGAIGAMFAFLTETAGLTQGDAGRLMTLVGNLRFCQVVDPLITARFEFPKPILAGLGFQGIA